MLTALHGRRQDGTEILFGLCPCARQEPHLVTRRGGETTMQAPPGPAMKPGDRWPDDMRALFDEAAAAFAAGAYTASAMVSRKILMVCACHEGAKEGESFAHYVDYVTKHVAPVPKSKDAVDKIRLIGNDANHRVAFVKQDDARAALKIVHYLLSTAYTFPTA